MAVDHVCVEAVAGHVEEFRDGALDAPVIRSRADFEAWL